MPPVDAENSVRKFRNVWDRAVYCERMAATVSDADVKARAGDQKVNGSPSRPGEFHPEPLTDPDLTLSRHPARATARRLPPSVENWSSSCCQLARSQRR
jgi:hypothetical protein